MNQDVTKLADEAVEMLIQTADVDAVFLNATSFQYLLRMLAEELLMVQKVDSEHTEAYEGMAHILVMLMQTLQTYVDRMDLQGITDISDLGEAL